MHGDLHGDMHGDMRSELRDEPHHELHKVALQWLQAGRPAVVVEVFKVRVPEIY